MTRAFYKCNSTDQPAAHFARRSFTPETLPMMLTERLNRRWFRYVPPAGSFPGQIYALLEAANAENWIEQVALKGREFNPGNPQLAEFAATIGLSPTNLTLERTIRNTNAFLDISMLREKLGRIEFQVCRIEVSTDQSHIAYGTGFLVGPDCVLTNHHVVDAVFAGEKDATTPDGYCAKPDNVRCRFDYKELDGQVLNPGTIIKLAQTWAVDLSEPDPAGPQKLDYALLRLESRVAEQPISTAPGNNGEKRGFIKIPSKAYPFPVGSPLVIVQHPAAGPLKIAYDTESIVSVAADRSRVKYKTNAENGSSGSPCFTQRLDPVALHQGNEGQDANIGIPLDLIRRLIAQHGLDQQLG